MDSYQSPLIGCELCLALFLVSSLKPACLTTASLQSALSGLDLEALLQLQQAWGLVHLAFGLQHTAEKTSSF